MSKQLINISALIGARVRRETSMGINYLVAPVTLLKEGVHHGSGGKIFYGADELAQYPEAWNGIPVPLDHPRSGEAFISANIPEVLARQNIGRLYNVQFDGTDKKLKGEVWIDVERADQLCPELIQRIENNEQIEVSTGLFYDTQYRPGWWNDEAYEGIARNMRPDHLAILMNAVGACSIADGCGILANVRGSARTPAFTGTESTSWADVKTTFKAYRDAYYKTHAKPDEMPSVVSDAPPALKSWIASKSLLGESDANNENDLIFFPVVNPGTGKLNEGALRAVISGRGSQANIPEAAKTSAQNKARSLLNKHFGAELRSQEERCTIKERIVRILANLLNVDLAEVPDKYNTYVSALQNELGHSELHAKLQGLVDTLDENSWIHMLREVFDKFIIYEARTANPNEIASSNQSSHLYKRDYTVGEDGTVKFEGEPSEVKEVTEYVDVANEQSTKANSESSVKEDIVTKNEKVAALIACKDTKFTEEDSDWLSALEEEQLSKLEVDHKEDSEEPQGKSSEEAEASTTGDENNAEPNAQTKEDDETDTEPMTMEAFLQKAPAELKDTLARAVDREKRIKTRLITDISANKRCEFTKDELTAMNTTQLERLAKLADVEVNYEAAPGAPVRSNVVSDDDTIIPAPDVFNLSREQTSKAS